MTITVATGTGTAIHVCKAGRDDLRMGRAKTVCGKLALCEIKPVANSRFCKVCFPLPKPTKQRNSS